MTEAADMLVPAGHKVVVERHYEAASPGGLELVSCCDVNIYLGKLLLRYPTWQIIKKKNHIFLDLFEFTQSSSFPSLYATHFTQLLDVLREYRRRKHCSM